MKKWHTIICQLLYIGFWQAERPCSLNLSLDRGSCMMIYVRLVRVITYSMCCESVRAAPCHCRGSRYNQKNSLWFLRACLRLARFKNTKRFHVASRAKGNQAGSEARKFAEFVSNFFGVRIPETRAAVKTPGVRAKRENLLCISYRESCQFTSFQQVFSHSNHSRHRTGPGTGKEAFNFKSKSRSLKGISLIRFLWHIFINLSEMRYNLCLIC